MPALTNRYEDDDAYHLPPGMKRIGYDEKSERYTFREGDDLWLGEPGSLYGGKMKWAGKAPDLDAGDGDDDGDDDDDDYSYSDSSEDCKIAKPRLRIANNSGMNENDWGVPVASISQTDAKPPDTSLGRRGTQLRKVAASTVSAIRVTRQWSRGKARSKPALKEKSSVDSEEEVDTKENLKMETKSFPEKGRRSLTN